ncbi:hypothetical protein [Amphiplicatus metriothermophilus]|uniref:Uncharacterized protein n=1 Tax=Amphiplicatus metriothermophilus TaxID=1519374 RepID=A0A239PVJ2_9PROT|nr:hypothetical protein [Amphiplicatus metriothermophilus]MBB5519627.1 hypothetical protein [Amphiplicatus metriothermophilus]SNT74190.1 hypothetical protein SAMN06297382_2099 [Amphiplicatus metriothermophilus]
MRYLIDLAVFVAVFFLGLMVFRSAFYGVLAAFVMAGAADALMTVRPAGK